MDDREWRSIEELRVDRFNRRWAARISVLRERQARQWGDDYTRYGHIANYKREMRTVGVTESRRLEAV